MLSQNPPSPPHESQSPSPSSHDLPPIIVEGTQIPQHNANEAVEEIANHSEFQNETSNNANEAVNGANINDLVDVDVESEVDESDTTFLKCPRVTMMIMIGMLTRPGSTCVDQKRNISDLHEN
ncbi:uncharacterized protein A4U43_C05F5370 [Asparagus officinalis]|uniref:Uncharacterized protein n=1 Tax=Asparagus officinalis TaxID=4686 RepID=A0A5P1EQJ7_ASPOF|nr:uncharacterized protein A4U43_C05F5370 [Asparagus officinalis]